MNPKRPQCMNNPSSCEWLPRLPPGLCQVQGEEKGEARTAKKCVVDPASASITQSGHRELQPSHRCSLDSFCWPLRAKRAEPWAFHHAHSCSEPRCGCPALGAAGRGCLRAREIPPDRANHSTTVFGISTIPHLTFVPSLLQHGSIRLKKKKKKIKGKTLINNNQDHLQF